MRGGLGNQMFQYAFGRQLANSRKELLILDLSDYGLSNRVFSLDYLNVRYDLAIKNRLVSRILNKFFKSKIFTDTSPTGENSSAENLNSKIFFAGYWENPVFFKNIESEIKKDFCLKNPSPTFTKIASKITKDSISVHVRRGDYLVPHGKYLNGFEYYNRAISLVINKLNLTNPTITIFTDDKEWCRKELSELGGIKTETFDHQNINDVEEMQLMSLYHHNIISNSTFSWWAAYLNKNPNKIIICPQNWFTDPVINENYIKTLAIKPFEMI